MRIFPGFDMIAANPTFAHRNSLLIFVRNDIVLAGQSPF